MATKKCVPDYIFESSWEVCNKVGGIYTVLSSRANTLQMFFQDKIIFIGPDLQNDANAPYFREDKILLQAWREQAARRGIKVRVGRWTVPGEPIAVLVDFRPYFSLKNDIYGWLWEHYRVDSLHAYGDYDEASMFSYAAGLVVESLYQWLDDASLRVVYHANEWMCGLGLLYVNNRLPQIGTVFTTHATTIGRSIAGNQKPLYDYLFAYNGDQMAYELNVQSKHSVEKQTAHYADCFTTVSQITANECVELLDKRVDVVLPNGFDDSFVPRGAAFAKKRREARRRMLDVANALLGECLGDDTLIVSTSGRYEFRNKGIDVFLEAMNRLLRDRELQKTVLAFIVVPGWVGEPRKDLQERMAAMAAGCGGHAASAVSREALDALEVPMITHWLHNMSHDNVLNMMKFYDMHNGKDDRVKVVFVPCYLDGHDGILNLSYYDVVLGNDLCIYPSYYEPWGYTPLEAVAFHVPCITTDLAGFGRWAEAVFGRQGEIEDGVKVVRRTDYNYSEVADVTKDTVAAFSAFSEQKVDTCRKNACLLSKKALWKEFIKFYFDAYDIALQKAMKRRREISGK